MASGGLTSFHRSLDWGVNIRPAVVRAGPASAAGGPEWLKWKRFPRSLLGTSRWDPLHVEARKGHFSGHHPSLHFLLSSSLAYILSANHGLSSLLLGEAPWKSL